MSETCIVCLGDLGESVHDLPHLDSAIKTECDTDEFDGSYSHNNTACVSPGNGENIELIAHLLPCGHNLHDECLKPWVERANSCPICRQNFNQVELSIKLGGLVISTYSVADRTQVADVDPSMIIEELEEDFNPCPECGEDDNEDVLLICDGCKAYYHTYCMGLDEVPMGNWFCRDCETQRAIESVRPLQLRSHSHNSSRRRTRGQQIQARDRNLATESNWARVWQTVWDRLNLDLDFPFDHGSSTPQHRQRTRVNRATGREFQQWERRLQIAERQGGINRFRDTAPALLDMSVSQPRPAPPEPESREEILAWNALEKAKDILADPTPKRSKHHSATTSPSDAGPVSRKRKRKSATSSPTDAIPAPQPQRRLKRPQTRRAHDLVESLCDSIAESSSSSRHRIVGGSRQRRTPDLGAGANGPSFLQSLLKEVESSAAPDESKGQAFSPLILSTVSPPDYSSPGVSPTTSNHPSPRALSATPPPSLTARSGSPTPLTSKVEPIYPPPEFSPERSPSSPKVPTHVHNKAVDLCTRSGRGPRSILPQQTSSSPTRSDEQSPSRPNMSLSTKSNVQKMVKDALKIPYHNMLLSKEEYTDINRNVSRMLYDKIGDSQNLNGDARESWQRMANDEVERAVRALRPAIDA
ncbi:MAG: hypothetical protein Q9187_000836 [Circinaria calcarea]